MDAKKVLLEVFDKVAVGVAALLLAVYLGLAFFAESPADRPREQVLQYNRRIEELERLAQANPPKFEELAFAREVEAALRGGPAPEPLPQWLFHKRPLIAVRVKSEQQQEPVHAPPMNANAVGGLGRVAVSWEDNTRNQFVNVDAYVVFRAEGAPAQWKQVARLDGKAHSYVDRDVRPRTTYYYYIESHASLDRRQPMVQKGKVAELPEDQRVQKSEIVGPVQTQRDTYVEVISATPKTTPQQIALGMPFHDASAYLKVWRHFPGEGWLSSGPQKVEPGATVGVQETVAGKPRDFRTEFAFETVVVKEIKRTIAGIERSVQANFVVLKDAKTGETLEISLEQPNPELEKIKRNPKEDVEGGA